MAVSILDILAERARQEITADSEYYKKGSWVFRVSTKYPFKGPVGGDGTAIFPLPIPPDRFDYSMPFSQEITAAQEGGVITEENGIIVADITLSGTTGFRLRRSNEISFAPSGGFFTGQLGEGGAFFQEISGQMAFWRLANRCFEGYSLLKKDPDLSADTTLELHIYKDQVHLEVVPVSFVVRRSAAGERVTYRYDIALKAVGEAKRLDYEPPSEKSLLDSIADTITKIRQAVQSVTAAIDDLTAAIDQIGRLASAALGILDDLGGIVGAATDFIAGVNDFLDFPRQFIVNVAERCEDLADFLDEVGHSDVAQTFRGIGDDMEAMTVAGRNHFTDDWAINSKKYGGLTDPYNRDKRDTESAEALRVQQAAAAENAAAAKGTLGIDQVFGSEAIRPGDEQRRLNSAQQRRLAANRYTGFEDRVVGQGDTLQSLAAKYLGGASDWLDIAIANNLRAPWITDGARIPGTLRPGDPVQIPVAGASRQRAVLTTGLEVEEGRSQAEANLGRDAELVRIGPNTWGWKIDPTTGKDITTVYGVDNLAQGYFVRFKTVRGENLMATDVGLPRLIGLPAQVDSAAEAKLRARQQLLADPRTDKLLAFSVSLENDVLSLTARVLPKGFAEPRVIARALT